ncbi:hypothetical protein D3C85_763410 [compost metagenome]
MAAHRLCLRPDPDALEPVGGRIDLAQPSFTHALRPDRRIAATPQDLGPSAVRPAQTRPLADRPADHRVHELRAAVVAGEIPGHGAGLCTGGRHLFLGRLRHRIFPARRPAPPPRPVHPAASGFPPTVADRQLRRLRRSPERPATGHQPRCPPGPQHRDRGQCAGRLVHRPVHPAFSPAHRPPDPQPTPGQAPDPPGIE